MLTILHRLAQSIPRSITQSWLLNFSQSFITPFHPRSAMLSDRAVESRWQVTGTLPITASYVLISHCWDWLTLMELFQCRTGNGTKWRMWLTDRERKEGLGHMAWWKFKGIMGIIRIPERGGEQKGIKRIVYAYIVSSWWEWLDEGKVTTATELSSDS